MMIAGSLSPRTESRLDPALPSSPRICRWTQVNTADNIDSPKESFFDISKSRSSKEKYLAKPKSVRRSSVSLPGISSALFNAFESESAPSNNPDLLGLPVVATSASKNDGVQLIDYDAENIIHRKDVHSDVMTKHDKNMKIIDLVSYANNQPLRKSTQHKYRAIRSAVQNRVKVVAVKEKSHSARRPRRENEETYLKCRFHERPCSRIGSFWIDNKISDLCRECCDVLGPKSCRECFQITQRATSKTDNEDMFPHIGAKPSEFSTMDLAHKMFPELSTLDILHHLKEGNISTEILQRHHIESYAQQRRKRSASERSRKIRERVNLYKAQEDDNFFQNFNDLKLQMVLKRKQTSTSTTILEPVRPLSSRPPPLEIEMIPVAENRRENPANYFDPPVMTQEEIKRQRSQPRFYAGEKSDYKLPETANMISVLKESNRALKNLSSSQTFGIIEEAEEEEEEENDGEDVGPEELMSLQYGNKNEELLSTSSNFYKPMDLTKRQNDLHETTQNHRRRFENEDDLLDTDKFFSEEARKLDSSSEDDSSSFDEECSSDEQFSLEK